MARRQADAKRMREEARARILRGAVDAFKEKGIHGASMELIARRAGVSKGLAYHYFASKNDLIAWAIDDWMRRLLEMWEGTALIADPLSALEHVLDRFCDSLASDPALYRLYLTIFMQLDYLRAVRAQASRSPELRDKVERIARLGRATFRQLGAADPNAEVRFFRLLTSGVAAEFIMDAGDFPLHPFKQRIIRYYRDLQRG